MHASALELAFQAGWFVKLVLAILAAFSIGSWTVILYKAVSLRAAGRQSELFLEAYRSADESRLLDIAGSSQLSPLARLFQAVRQHRGRRRQGDAVLTQHVTLEARRLHAYLPFLASTGSTTPFIGLLGTVWGIMDAFRGIGTAGSASLAVVAPAIAEALIATAAGLLAAIPAVVAYNYFLSHAARLTEDLENFAEELRGDLARGGT
jgi:biopolymer transport protein TolQ